MKHVWEVRAEGGAPHEIKVAVQDAVERLRSGQGPYVDGDTEDAWRTGLIAISVADAASYEGTTSVIVEAETYDDGLPTAALLSGDFDGHVLDEVLSLQGVTSVSTSDRIERAR